MGSSSEAALGSSLHAVGTESSSSPVSKVRLDALVISDNEPLESVRVLSEDIGTAVDGSSLEAILLSESKPMSNSVLAASFVPCAVDFPASPLCRDREDSFSGPADSVFSPVTKETLVKADRIPSLAKGLIRRGFFSPRAVPPSSLVVMEASMSSQGKEEVPVKADKIPVPEKGLIHQGCFGSKIASPPMPWKRHPRLLLTPVGQLSWVSVIVPYSPPFPSLNCAIPEGLRKRLLSSRIKTRSCLPRLWLKLQ